MKKYKKIIFIIISIVFIFIIYVFVKRGKYQNLYDDILFLKFFGKESVIVKQTENEQESKQYVFKMNCENTDFKNVDLLKTVDRKTLMNEKIAPGVEGEFQIVLEANEDTNYNIIFQSKSSKPKNLKFENVETKTQKENLEDLNSELTGRIKENEKKIITIHWAWQYENTKEQNQRDTLDGRNIQEYQFTICANGQSVI